MSERTLRQRIRFLLVLFIIGLVMSGLTAFPLEWEVRALARLMGATDAMTPSDATGLLH